MSARSHFLATLVPLALLGPTAVRADAQVVALFLKDEKAAKKFEERVVMVNGRQAVLGEPKVGITVDGNGITRNPNVMIELWVADPDDPAIPAYALDRKGDVQPGSKKTILRVDGSALPTEDYATIVMRDESIPSLSREFVLRRDAIDALRAQRDTLDRTTTEWAAQHLQVVTEMEGLQTWLANTLWPKYAAEKYEKEIVKEAKAHKGQAVRARHDKALASLKPGEVPAKLLELSQELSQGTDKFNVRETQHMRVYFIDTITAEAVEEALKLGEEVIEGFRARFVDPYLGADYADQIPDDVFQEFLFTPTDADKFVGYTKGYWGIDWSQRREERIEMGGGRSDGSTRTKYRSWRKYDENMDLQGMVCHQLGHALAGLHYGPAGNIKQDWLSEALGYYLSFEFLARNTVTCKAFDSARSGYVKKERERTEGEKTVGEGRRDLYNAIALELGRPIDQLARKDLFELDDADLAKSWSFFDYIARSEGKPGQLWLRSAGKHSHNAQTFIAAWRKDAATILGVDEGEAFKALDARWRSFAETKGHKEDK
jgi:hypothetical protein